MNFAQKLQKRRKEVGFSQEQLAFELNVSRQAVSKWESGQGYPEVEKLIQLSELLGISLDELMKETREHPSAPIKPLDEEEPEWRDEPHSPVTLPDDIHEEDSLIGRFAYSTDRDTVERYLDLNQRFARWIAVGVGMMVAWTDGGSLPVAVASLVPCALIGPVQILPALFIPQLFGMKDYTSINAFGMGGFYLGGAAVFVIVAAVMQNLGYNMGFIVLAACGIAALVLFLAAIALSPMKRLAANGGHPKQ